MQEGAAVSASDLSSLSDEARPAPFKYMAIQHDSSPRLAMVLSQLPSTNRSRVTRALHSNGVFTLNDLCDKRRTDLRRWNNLGKKCINDLEMVLASFNLTLMETPDQRVTSSRWYRTQLQDLIDECSVNAAVDRDLSVQEDTQVYAARLKTTLHFKRHLERILRGQTAYEALYETLHEARIK
jgi:hypothetical protein